MPSYDYVSLPPASNLYGAIPNVNFDWLGNLGKDFQQGQQYGQLRKQQTALQDPSLYDEQGNLDYNKALQKYFQLGGTQSVAGVAPLMIQQQLGAQDAAAAGRLYGTDTGNAGDKTGQGGGAGAQPAPQGPQGSPPPFMGGSTARPGAPANGVGPQNIGGQYTGNAIGQGPSIRESVAANGGTDQQALQVAARLGIDPNAPISQQDAPRIGRLLASMGIGQRFGQRSPDAATNQETGPISTGEVSAQAGETNSTTGANALGPAAASPGPSIPGMGGGGPAAGGRDSVPQPGSTPPGGTSGAGVRYPPGITPQLQQQLQDRARAAHIQAVRVARQNPEAAKTYEAIAADAQSKFNDNQKAINDYNAPTPEQKNLPTVATAKREEGVGAATGKVLSDYIDKGQSAYKRIQMLDTITDALQRGGGNITTGPFAETALHAKQAISSLFGIDMEGVQEAEVAQKTGFGLASQAVKEITSRPTQMEVKFALQNNPGLLLSQKGSLFMADVMKQAARQDIDLAADAQKPQYRDNWPQHLDEYYKAHPLISPFDHKTPLGMKDVQAIGGGAPQYKEGDTATNPKTKERIIFRNGKWGPAGKDLGA